MRERYVFHLTLRSVHTALPTCSTWPNLNPKKTFSEYTQFTPQHTLQFGHNPPQMYILDEPNLLPFERGSVGLA